MGKECISSLDNFDLINVFLINTSLSKKIKILTVKVVYMNVNVNN